MGAIVWNNVPDRLYASLKQMDTNIAPVGISGSDGNLLMAKLGQDATVAVTGDSYAYYTGTSMATPPLSAVAALVWSYFPSCTSKQIRATLAKSAEDLGAAGRDNQFGYRSVQAKAAYTRIASRGCGSKPVPLKKIHYGVFFCLPQRYL